VLLALSRTSPDLERAASILCRHPVSLANVATASVPHGTAALVHASLLDAREKDAFPISAEAMEILEQKFTHQHIRMRHLASCLGRILARFGEAKIDSLQLKGPTLGSWLYDGDYGMRPSCDLDILVHPRDFSAASAILLDEGFAHVTDEGEENETGVYSRAKDRVTLELHSKVRLGERALEPGEEWWDGAVEAQLPGVTAHIFSPARLLVYLASHGSKNYWQRLSWLCDVAELLRREERRIDWDELSALARKLGCRARTNQALLLASRLLDAPVPQRSRRAIASHLGARWMFGFHLDCMERAGTGRPSPGGTALARLLQAGNRTDQVRAIKWTFERWFSVSPEERAQGLLPGQALLRRTRRLLLESRHHRER
jgi:hypothetical protein